MLDSVEPLGFLGPLAGIVLVDLALSGDNALVIGAAASGLPRRQRLMAIITGGAGAIILRIGFAILATLLLQLPLLEALGGLVLIVIAIRLLADRDHGDATSAADGEASGQARKQRSLWGALITIIAADVTMSLDNVLAVGALAHGDIPLLATGLLLSIALLMLGSALVAELIQRLPWLMDVAALVLGWTAANMLLHDQRLHPYLEPYAWMTWAIPAVILAIILVADILLRVRAHRAAAA